MNGASQWASGQHRMRASGYCRCKRSLLALNYMSRSPVHLRLWACLCLAFLLAQTPSIASAVQAQTENQATGAPTANPDLHPILVELFTSEGCSSCPPADVLLEKIDEHQPIPGAQLIVLSEHVDYWDHDGWKDPNSSALLTERQNSYEHTLGHDTPFTPQMIVDGTTEVHLGNSQQTQDVLLKAKATPMIPVHISEVTFDAANPEVLRAHIESDANDDKHNADVYVAVALDHVESQVLKGENGGKHLTHVAVVQELTKVGKIGKGKSFSQYVQVKLKPGTDPKNVRVVAFVQESGQGKLLGAALHMPSS
jgi:hypothetical protein